MKRKIIINLTILFGLVISFCTLSIVQAAPLTEGDTFDYTRKLEWKFTDRLGQTHNLKETSSVATKITGVNSTWVNYTEITKTEPFDYTFLFQNGYAYIQEYDSYVLETTDYEENRIADSYPPKKNQYVNFQWIDFPEWNNDTAGIEYQGWNDTSYSSRFWYFDMEADNALDVFSLTIDTPFFADNSTELIEIIETQWNVYAYGIDLSDLPKPRWNRTSTTIWDSFRTLDLYSDIAYSVEIISTDSSDNAEILEFTPQWIGQIYLPDNYLRWNGTDWDYRFDPKTEYAGDGSPVYNNGSHIVLQPNFNYYGYHYLNQRRDGINGSTQFDNIKTTFNQNSFSIEFEVGIEDAEKYTFHTAQNWAEYRRNNGTLNYYINCQYHPEKGYIQSYEQRTEYDFGDNGKYSFIETIRPGTGGGGASGFEFPVLFFSLVLIALVIRRKKL